MRIGSAAARRRGGRQLVEPVPLGPADVGGPAEPLEQPDGARRDVQLAAVHAVPGAGRIGVVAVVPGLAHAQDRQRPEVGGPVAGGVGPLADHVADRVDRPGDVVQQADPDQRGPEEGGQRAGPGPAEQAAEHRRAEHREGHPERELPIDPDQVRIGQQVRRVLVLVGLLGVEQPAHVREPEALGQAGQRLTEPPGRVRVTVPVGEGVVPAVVGHPADHRALDRQRAGDRERDLQTRGWP